MQDQDSQKILTKMEEIFKAELDNENVKLTFETVAADIEGWDSLAHAQLMFSVEKAFGVSFLTSEIKSFRNVADIVQAVKTKAQGK